MHGGNKEKRRYGSEIGADKRMSKKGSDLKKRRVGPHYYRNNRVISITGVRVRALCV